MRKYFKTNPEINVPSPLPTQAKQVCFETLNTINIENTGLWVLCFFFFFSQKRLVVTITEWLERVKCEKVTASLLVDRIFFPLIGDPGNLALLKKKEGKRIIWRITR